MGQIDSRLGYTYKTSFLKDILKIGCVSNTKTDLYLNLFDLLQKRFINRSESDNQTIIVNKSKE